MKRDAARCLGCGTCLRFCPIFEATRLEPFGPRAKALLCRGYLEGSLQMSGYLQRIFAACVLCRGCSELCPPAVEVTRLVLGMRAEFVRKKGLPHQKRLLFERLVKNKGFFLKDGVCSADAPPPSLKDLFPEFISPPANRPKMRVGFFSGCDIGHIHTRIGEATIKLLLKHGCEVVHPASQVCCGMPVFAAGDLSTAMELAEMNRKSFEEARIDAIITACAACGTALKHLYKEFAEHTESEKPMQRFSGKVFDVAEFLVEKLSFLIPENALNKRITYHDPCHLLRAQKISSQPRQLLGSLQGVELVELSHQGLCCGGDGGLEMEELSEEIGDMKAESILGSKAQLVVTGCPGCIGRIETHLRKRGDETGVLHTVELLAGLFSKR